MQKKFAFVDALRGMAVLLVIFAHTGQMYPLPYPKVLQELVKFGPRGVQLFFVVSAFTLFLSYESRAKKDSRPIFHFFIRRFFRIAPLYYAGLIFYSILENKIITLSNLVINISFLNALNPKWLYEGLVPGGWSISCEILFYLFVPILVPRIKSLNKALAFTFTALLASFIFQAIVIKFNFGFDKEIWNYTNYMIPLAIPYFGIGICFYFIIFREDFSVKPNFLAAISILLVIGLIFESGFLYKYFQTVAFGILAVALSRQPNILFVNRVIRYFGKMSYSMYISHFFVVELIEKQGLLNALPHNNGKELIVFFVAKFILIVVLTIGIASVLFWIIETPGQNLGLYLIKLTDKERLTTKSKQVSDAG